MFAPILQSPESASVAWLVLCGVLFVQLIPHTVGQLNESRYEWSWHTRLIPVCVPLPGVVKRHLTCMEKMTKLAEELCSVETFGWVSGLYKKSSTYPKKAIQGTVW